ncbi:TonB-dependent receptor [Cypionkella aquatica]|uniref:TonB-dependent receptor n=1 Tax=Cypionkella aquatica TaxID=1756042 RepID=A0AA37WZF7_9RHOB|nr:TonB-dependent receptor [Cypionkella aquatica]GLS86087.1 TonB-dependent receptor [Cypionkella aquatica]
MADTHPSPHSRRRSVLLSTVAVLLLQPLPAAAQQADPLEDILLGTIVLNPERARERDPDGQAADRQASEYVADAELDRARMGDLKDLFAGIASVSVGGAIPVAQKIFVHGVDMLNLAVTVDGVAQNNRIFHHVSANAFDPGLMKFVRVDAGAAAADAGPNALAGAVVMETVDAADVLDEGDNFGGNARLSFGENGDTFGRSATVAGRQGGFEWLLYLKSVTGDDYKAGGGDTVTGTAADLQSGLAKLAYATADGHRFELSAQTMQDDTLRPYRANIGEIIGGRPVPPTRRYDTKRSTYALSYENTQASGMWDPRLVIGFSEVQVNVPDPYQSEGASDTRSVKLENRFHLANEGSITAGVDYYDRGSRYHDPASDLREGAQNVGLYAQARLAPTDRLDLSFGLRWDQQKFKGVDDSKQTVSGFSGNASVAYHVTEALTLRGGVSAVFGGISIEDNYVFDDRWNYDAVKAAKSRNYTLGFDWEIGDLKLDGELFRTEVDDARGVVGAAITNFDFESQGFNLGLGYGWDDGFLRASYSHSKVKVNGAPASSYDALDFGAPLGGVFALEVQHSPAGSDFTFGGSIDAALAYNQINSDSDRKLPGYAVLNLFTEYTPPSLPNLILRGEVNNLFDTKYSDRATYGADYSTVVPLREPGRNLSIVATMKF